MKSFNSFLLVFSIFTVSFGFSQDQIQDQVPVPDFTAAGAKAAFRAVIRNHYQVDYSQLTDDKDQKSVNDFIDGLLSQKIRDLYPLKDSSTKAQLRYNKLDLLRDLAMARYSQTFMRADDEYVFSAMQKWTEKGDNWLQYIPNN